LANRVPWSIHHFIERYWANVGADAVSDADIPISRDVGSVDSKCFRGIY